MSIPNKKKYISKQYNDLVGFMIKMLGNKSTFSDNLDKVGRKKLGTKFHGVYPSDKIPKLNRIKPYAVINLDNSRKPGSHWVAIAWNDNARYHMVYDSFGRKTQKILPNFYNQRGGKKIIDTEYDAEQRIKEDNCGQRCLAWLMCVDKFGFDLSKLV